MQEQTLLQRVLSKLNRIRAYHGSPFDFEEFTFKNLGRNDPGDYGRGFYFDTDFKQAVGYIQNKSGFLYTCDLDLSAPYLIERSTSDKDKELSELARYKETLKDGGLVADENNFLSISRKHGAKNISSALTKAGYDGVIVNWGSSKEIVVFDSKKISIVNKEQKEG